MSTSLLGAILVGGDNNVFSTCGCLHLRALALLASVRFSVGCVETRSQSKIVCPTNRMARLLLKSCVLCGCMWNGLSLTFLVSFLYNGGGIHGSQTSPGIWKAFGPISAGMVVLSFLLATALRSRGTLLLVAWLLGVFAANYAVFQLAFD